MRIVALVAVMVMGGCSFFKVVRGESRSQEGLVSLEYCGAEQQTEWHFSTGTTPTDEVSVCLHVENDSGAMVTFDRSKVRLQCDALKVDELPLKDRFDDIDQLAPHTTGTYRVLYSSRGLTKGDEVRFVLAGALQGQGGALSVTPLLVVRR